MKAHLTLTFALLLVCAGAGAAMAQTSPPAMTLQDFQALFNASTQLGTPDGVPPSRETVCNGQTGAAYGLCVAYCEAMDCDTGPQASQKACNKVAANYTRITGQGLPCDCPCVGRVPGFLEAISGQFGVLACFQHSDPNFAFVSIFTADPQLQALSLFSTEGSFCGVIPGGFLTLTSAQALACNALALQKLAAAGFTCQVQ